MNTIDLTPLYRSSIGFDRFGSLLDSALRSEQSAGYPPYNIEVVDENKYAITLALAGFDESDIDIQTEKGVLTIKGKKEALQGEKQFLHQGIANRSFERKFNLADHVEVQGANLDKGLLTIHLLREIPEAMKPRTIQINGANDLSHDVSNNVSNEISNEVYSNISNEVSEDQSNASEKLLEGQAA